MRPIFRFFSLPVRGRRSSLCIAGFWLLAVSLLAVGRLAQAQRYLSGLKVDTLGNVYVTDGNRMQKFDPDGKFNTGFGSSGSDHGQFNGMQGMTETANGDVYIVDEDNACVEVFAPARFDLGLDGNTDLLWQNTTTGDVSYWLLDGLSHLAGVEACARLLISMRRSTKNR